MEMVKWQFMTDSEFNSARIMVKSRNKNDIELGLQLLANHSLTQNQVNSMGRWLRRNWYLFALTFGHGWNCNYDMLGKTNSYCFYIIIQDFK